MRLKSGCVILRQLGKRGWAFSCFIRVNFGNSNPLVYLRFSSKLHVYIFAIFQHAKMRAVARIFALFEFLKMLKIWQNAKNAILKKNENEEWGSHSQKPPL